MKQQDLTYTQDSTNPLADLAKTMQTVSTAKVVKVSTRKVRLIMMALCGCGELPVEIEREVLNSSPLQDGDQIYHADLLPTDELV